MDAAQSQSRGRRWLLAAYVVVAVAALPAWFGMAGSLRDRSLAVAVLLVLAGLTIARVRWVASLLALLTGGLGLRSILGGAVMLVEGKPVDSTPLGLAMLLGGAVLLGGVYWAVRVPVVRQYVGWDEAG